MVQQQPEKFAHGINLEDMEEIKKSEVTEKQETATKLITENLNQLMSTNPMNASA